jgi:phenylpyruvate tautomerase PptA (4-oxalocrotonate tautomerase family)
MLEVPAEGNDPTTNYSSKLNELNAHAPIIANVAADGTITSTSVYLQDRETVWVMIEEVTRDHACHIYTLAAART